MNKITFLKVYALTITGLVIICIYIVYINSQTKDFVEISVERINVVEKDGKIKMVISNQYRQHPGMMNGIQHDDRVRPSGILFFNDEQDEIGGISYYGNKESGGNNLYLSFDQYKEDQIMHLMQYSNDDGDNRYGIQLWTRDKDFTMMQRLKIMDSLEKEGYNYPRKLNYIKQMNKGIPVLAPRLFLGKNYNGATGLYIQDKFGMDRIRLYVDENDQAKFELLNAKGDVESSQFY